MADISVLSRELAELIAAGEVIERPASVLKELTENAVDAGATHITAELKRGGVLYLRVTDDGCGIPATQVRTAFLRHATSKIAAVDDLESILTLGFRGEALASVCAVSRTEMLTRTADADLGAHLVIEGGEEQSFAESGCPVGTTIVVRDLFYNVPVRAGFLKKDTAEGNAAASVFQKIALSHPEIAFRLIRENKTEFCTPGDGNLYSAIYAIFGKEFARDLLPVQYEEQAPQGITVTGYAIKPLYAKPSRAFQFFVVNGRTVRSMTCSKALEEAYQTLVMTGKYPACVLHLQIPPRTVDVNMHPTKAEVRFSDESRVFSAVYFAAMNALTQNGLLYDFRLPQARTMPAQKASLTDWFAPLPGQDDNTPAPLWTDAPHDATPPPVPESVPQHMPQHLPQAVDEILRQPEASAQLIAPAQTVASAQLIAPAQTAASAQTIAPAQTAASAQTIAPTQSTGHAPVDASFADAPKAEPMQSATGIEPVSAPAPSAPGSPMVSKDPRAAQPIRVIGELFRTYILAESGDQFVMIDKHAAHERILFERFRRRQCKDRQLLMQPTTVLLPATAVAALQEYAALLESVGFTFSFAEAPIVRLTGVPMSCAALDFDTIVPELANQCAMHLQQPDAHLLDDFFHSLACKAAIRAGDHTTPEELQALATRVWQDDSIRHCPHGRPTLFLLSNYQIEKQFQRIPT